MHTRELPRLVPVDDAMRELGNIGRTTLYELIGQGHLVRAKIGRRAFITGDSIAAYINAITQSD